MHSDKFEKRTHRLCKVRELDFALVLVGLAQTRDKDAETDAVDKFKLAHIDDEFCSRPKKIERRSFESGCVARIERLARQLHHSHAPNLSNGNIH